MTHSLSPGRFVAPVLDALAEGALLWVIYIALGGPSTAGLPLGLVEFVIAAAFGLGFARQDLSPRARGAALLTLAVFAGAFGWLADPATRAVLQDAGLSRALGVHAPGWLLGVAVWRGSAHLDPASDDRVASRLLAVGVPLLALPWLMHVGSGSGAIAGPTLVGSVVFVAATLLAIAHGRLAGLGLDPATTSGAWSRTVLVVTVGLAVLALAGAIVLDASLSALLGLVGAPLAGGLAALVAALAPLAAPMGNVLSSALGHAAPTPVPAHGAGGVAPPTEAIGGAAVSPLVGPVLALAAVLVVALLVRYRHEFRSPRLPPYKAPSEDRSFVRPRLSLRLDLPTRRLTLPRRQPAPTDAATAYVAVLHLLASRPELARQPVESPLAHARRVRTLGLPDAALSLLAADFQLQRYGDRSLGPREHEKALTRWRRIRAAVRAHRPARDV